MTFIKDDLNHSVKETSHHSYSKNISVPLSFFTQPDIDGDISIFSAFRFDVHFLQTLDSLCSRFSLPTTQVWNDQHKNRNNLHIYLNQYYKIDTDLSSVVTQDTKIKMDSYYLQRNVEWILLQLSIVVMKRLSVKGYNPIKVVSTPVKQLFEPCLIFSSRLTLSNQRWVCGKDNTFFHTAIVFWGNFSIFELKDEKLI